MTSCGLLLLNLPLLSVKLWTNWYHFPITAISCAKTGSILIRLIYIMSVHYILFFYLKFYLNIDLPPDTRYQRKSRCINCAREKLCLDPMLDLTVSSALLFHIWKKQVKVIILWNKWKSWRCCISHLCATQVDLRISYIQQAWLSRLSSISTGCFVNMTDMLIRVLFIWLNVEIIYECITSRMWCKMCHLQSCFNEPLHKKLCCVVWILLIITVYDDCD